MATGRRSKRWSTLRRITEGKAVAILELREGNLIGDEVEIGNTVRNFAFNDAGLIDGLDIYYEHMERRPAGSAPLPA